MDNMFKRSLLCILLHVTISKVSTESNGYLVSVNNVEFHGNERFPEVIDVLFGNQGSDIFLQLERDDEATELLSEELFEASKILPSRLFKEENSECFAAYNTGDSDLVVVHRESVDAKPKFYGRFTQNNEKLLIQSETGSHELHRVRREENLEHHRQRRAVAGNGLLELFVFADLSVFEQVRDEYLSSGSTKDIKDFTSDYMNALAKEVNYIYESVNLTVYFQQYQVITKSSQQKWVTDNYSNSKLQTNAVTDFQAYYYNTLMTKFAFPYPDHLMALTRLDMEGDVQVMTAGSICGTTTSIGSSIARIQTYPTSLAQGIAYTFSVEADSDTSCLDSDQYVMSNIYDPSTSAANQGNRWLFSSCSITAFDTAFGGGSDVSCLQTQDTIFDLEEYENSQSLNELLNLDEQCVLLYQNGSTFCGTQGSIDCYSSSSSTIGCLVSSVCEPMHIPQGTSCSSKSNFICSFGSCVTSGDITTITSTTNATTTAMPTTTTDGDFQTTTTDGDFQTTTTDGGFMTTTTDSPTGPTGSTGGPTSAATTTPNVCVVETGFVEFDLPGCGCCGGCGCDTECGADCSPGLPSQTQAESCTKEPSCCGSKVRVTTLFVPSGCELTYENGPQTIVMEKKGWENDEAEVTAEVYQDSNDRWQVMLAPQS